VNPALAFVRNHRPFRQFHNSSTPEQRKAEAWRLAPEGKPVPLAKLATKR